jgi:hypothetical protein
MGGRSFIVLGAVVAAALTAVALGTVAHDALGFSRTEIRVDALGGAALLAIAWCASLLRTPPQ